jgi:hypothetical protein
MEEEDYNSAFMWMEEEDYNVPDRYRKTAKTETFQKFSQWTSVRTTRSSRTCTDCAGCGGAGSSVAPNEIREKEETGLPQPPTANELWDIRNRRQ